VNYLPCKDFLVTTLVLSFVWAGDVGDYPMPFPDAIVKEKLFNYSPIHGSNNALANTIYSAQSDGASSLTGHQKLGSPFPIVFSISLVSDCSECGNLFEGRGRKEGGRRREKGREGGEGKGEREGGEGRRGRKKKGEEGERRDGEKERGREKGFQI